MDKLSELIKEAKPLYRQRKRRKTIAKLIFGICTPVILFTGVCQVYLMGCDIYMALNDNQLQNELLNDEYGLFGI